MYYCEVLLQVKRQTCSLYSSFHASYDAVMYILSQQAAYYVLDLYCFLRFFYFIYFFKWLNYHSICRYDDDGRESLDPVDQDLSDDDPEAYVTNLSYYHLVPFETDILE